MDINNKGNLISKLSVISEEELKEVEVSVSLVTKQKESDLYYDSLEISLAPEVKEWLKKYIKQSLDSLKGTDDNEIRRFFVSDYNHEIKKQDNIAKYELLKSQDLKKKKDQLITSLRNSNTLYNEKNTNFQMVKISYESKDAFFCFYRGTKKNSSRKKTVFKNSNRFDFFEDTVIDLGGNIDLIVIDDHILIMNVTSFENVFDYRDHINKLRDKNLTSIVSMEFFDGDDSNRSVFENKCKTYIYSRGIAQIKDETLIVLQEKFVERCKELKKIKQKAPKDKTKRLEYIEKLGTLWELFEYIDVEKHKIIYKEGKSPTPLIHFFSDKIVKSFLTEDIKVALAYE